MLYISSFLVLFLLPLYPLLSSTYFPFFSSVSFNFWPHFIPSSFQYFPIFTLFLLLSSLFPFSADVLFSPFSSSFLSYFLSHSFSSRSIYLPQGSPYFPPCIKGYKPSLHLIFMVLRVLSYLHYQTLKALEGNKNNTTSFSTLFIRQWENLYKVLH